MNRNNNAYKNNKFKNKKVRTIDGVRVQTLETEISSLYNSLTVEVGTTGYMGGDSRKGGRTFLKILNTNNSDFNVRKDASGQGFSLRLGGDTELDTLIESLEFAVNELKKQRNATTSKEFVSNKKHTYSENAATSKQLSFLRSLLNKNGYSLIDKNLDKVDAISLIEIFKEYDSQKNIPAKYAKYIRKEGSNSGK
jgi:hypothetical protein